MGSAHIGLDFPGRSRFSLETGFERNYQSTMCMPVWDIDLTSGPRDIHVKLFVNGLNSHNDVQ